jgi:hypothetical protein
MYRRTFLFCDTYNRMNRRACLCLSSILISHVSLCHQGTLESNVQNLPINGPIVLGESERLT